MNESAEPVIYDIRSDRVHMIGQVDDHYPLTLTDVLFLLERAKEAADHPFQHHTSDVSSIQVRLVQAIPGIKSPREAVGPVAERKISLNRAYTDWLESGSDREAISPVADRLFTFMRA